MKDIYFEIIEDKTLISPLEKEWRKSLTFPNDDYWEYVLSSCTYWAVKQGEEIIGYAGVNNNNVLLQFFVSAQWLEKGRLILEKFLQEKEIKSARIETNNPVCLSLSMHFQKSVVVDGYLFSDMTELVLEEKVGNFRMAELEDLENLVDFSHRVLEAPKDWLTDYIGNLIKREEFFLFEKDNQIIGTCEVRTTAINENVASLGIVVSPEYRRQGFGTYLLGKAKTIAKSRNKQAICGCSKDNIGSLKASSFLLSEAIHSFVK